MVATVLLVTRYRRPLPVWVGVTAAFAVHVTVAVVAGSALRLLPETPVQVAVAGLFACGAVLLLRAARRGAGSAEEPVSETARRSAPAVVLASLGMILLAEWGDLTQLATASLAARSGDAFATGVGALGALATVAAVAATFGHQIVSRVSIEKINYLAAAVFAALAVWTLAELVG